MKALSLWQPWATAIALGSKTIETRDWPTSYRGPLAIHAAKRLNKAEMIYYKSCWNWCGALRNTGWRMGDGKFGWETLPFGAIVAVCELVDCRPTESFPLGLLRAKHRPATERGELYEWTQEQMGNFDLGRFGFVLDGIMQLPAPIPFKGAQGFFHVPDELLPPITARSF